MKILIYSHDGWFYGAPRSLFELVWQLRNNHDIIYLIPEHGPIENVLNNSGFKYRIIPNPQWIYSVRQQGYSRWFFIKHIVKTFCLFIFVMFGAYKKSKSVIKEISPDVIFINTCTAPLGLYVAHHFKIPSVLFVRESICNKNGIYVPTFFSNRYVAKVLNKADIIVCPSFFLKSHIEKTFEISNVQVLPNPISYTPKFVSIDMPEYKFGIVGYISERKGQLEFFKSMLANMPNGKLSVFGTGTNGYAQELNQMAKIYPENIKLFGYESNPDIIYSTFSIYVNMGIDETFGRTTVEAMRAGKLVFGRRSGATPEIIRHGKNGFLFDNVDEIFAILKEYDTDEGHKRLSYIREQGKTDSLVYSPEKIKMQFESILSTM